MTVKEFIISRIKLLFFLTVMTLTLLQGNIHKMSSKPFLKTTHKTSFFIVLI